MTRAWDTMVERQCREAEAAEAVMLDWPLDRKTRGRAKLERAHNAEAEALWGTFDAAEKEALAP